MTKTKTSIPSSSPRISAQSATEGYIELDRGDLVRARVSFGDYGARGLALPELQFRRSYAAGSIADWRDAIVSTANGSPVHANTGAMPFLTEQDLADWRTVVEEASARRWALRRIYSSHASVSLADFSPHGERGGRSSSFRHSAQPPIRTS